jgi:heavy metal sensor kinase
METGMVRLLGESIEQSHHSNHFAIQPSWFSGQRTAGMKIRSVRLKFTLWYVGSFLILILFSGILATMLFEIFALRSIDNGLHNGAALLIRKFESCAPLLSQYKKSEFQACFDTGLRDLFVNELVLAQLLIVPNGSGQVPTVLIRSYTLKDSSLPIIPNLWEHIQNGTPHFETFRRLELGTEVRQISLPLHAEEQDYILQLAIVLHKEEQDSVLRPSWTNLPHLFMYVFPFVLALTTIWGYIFMRKAFAPIHNIVTLATNITAEDLSLRIEGIDSDDEIGELADTLNAMIARLDASFQQIRQFSGDVAHELKTPLTALKGELEVALRKDRSPEEYRDILNSLQEDTENLQHIIEDLLFLARMDAQSIPLSFQQFSLDEVVLEIYESALGAARKKGVSLALPALDSIDIAGDAGLIKRLLTNLVVNAIHYTPEGGKVELAVKAAEDTTCITVRDTGIGIPADALPHIFDRFYRVDQSRSHDTGGSGLGLAIVQKIAEVHNAQIDVQSQAGNGSTFLIIWKC